MAFYGLRLEYALDGSSNYIAWKDHMEAILEDNGLKDFIDQEIPKPTDKTEQVEWRKCVGRARRILLEGVRDHIVSSLQGKETPHAMWKTLKGLYQNSSDQRKLALKDKLRKIKCEKGDSISTFLNKLTTCRELACVGVTTADEAMEEIRWSTKDGASSLKHDDEENTDLASKAKKGKASHSKSSQGGKKFENSKVRCFHCHELGHYANNCPKRKSKKKGSSKESDGDKNLFSTLEEKDLLIQIEMGDDGKYYVSGRGLKKNLMSIAMLEDNGYDVVFSLGKVFLRHIRTGQTKQIGIRIKNLYKLHVEICASLSSKAEVVHGQDIGELWHRRLGHLHHGALKIMQQISTGLPKCKLEQISTCKGCALGKYAKASFHDRDGRVGVVLDRVHSDVCGPFSTDSTAKKRYFVIFIEDFSCRCWIYFMQKKDQTFLNFCEFKALTEKESRRKIKALQSDNGGEYVSQQFKDFYALEGIKWELTTPHNPQQNGVVERNNRSIMGAARAMLHDQILPLHMWAEACNTTLYLHNRSPHLILG
eukprot:PITA_30310